MGVVILSDVDFVPFRRMGIITDAAATIFPTARAGVFVCTQATAVQCYRAL